MYCITPMTEHLIVFVFVYVHIYIYIYIYAHNAERVITAGIICVYTYTYIRWEEYILQLLNSMYV